jgi:hypothetical protein
LKRRKRYIVDRSEFQDVKERFIALARLEKEERDGSKRRRGPVLRRTGGTISTEPIETNEEPVEDSDEDERPKLKRK